MAERITDLVQIKILGEKKREENDRFRQHLRRHYYNEKKFRQIADDEEMHTDCRSCANCCRSATVRLHERDVEKLAKALRVKPGVVLREYTEPSEEEGRILKRTADGACVFLNGNDCLVYESRPQNCVDFPHLVRGAGSFHKRMWDFKDRATYCPIVYNTLERLKPEVGFDPAKGRVG